MKRNSPGDCSSCTERWFCKELCPDAERIIGQDYVPQNTNEHLAGSLYPKPLPHVDAHTDLKNIPEIFKAFIDFYSKTTPMEVKIFAYLMDGKTRKEISDMFNITTNSVYIHTFNLKAKFIESFKYLLM